MALIVIHMTESVIVRKDIVVTSAKVFVPLIVMAKTAQRFVDAQMEENVITFLVNVIVHQDLLVHCKFLAFLFIAITNSNCFVDVKKNAPVAKETNADQHVDVKTEEFAMKILSYANVHQDGSEMFALIDVNQVAME